MVERSDEWLAGFASGWARRSGDDGLGEQVARNAERRALGDPRNYRDSLAKAQRWTLAKHDLVVRFPGNPQFRTEWLEAHAYEEGLRRGYQMAKYEAELGVL